MVLILVVPIEPLDYMLLIQKENQGLKPKGLAGAHLAQPAAYGYGRRHDVVRGHGHGVEVRLLHLEQTHTTAAEVRATSRVRIMKRSLWAV